jgi:hypothetical protein
MLRARHPTMWAAVQERAEAGEADAYSAELRVMRQVRRRDRHQVARSRRESARRRVRHVRRPARSGRHRRVPGCRTARQSRSRSRLRSRSGRGSPPGEPEPATRRPELLLKGTAAILATVTVLTLILLALRVLQ